MYKLKSDGRVKPLFDVLYPFFFSSTYTDNLLFAIITVAAINNSLLISEIIQIAVCVVDLTDVVRIGYKNLWSPFARDTHLCGGRTPAS